MKILFCSVPFRPSVGGIEQVSALLADGFHRAGHSVTLVTQTPLPQQADSRPDEAYRVLRRPRWHELLALVRQADVVFHNNISLRLAWPLLIWRRPWVIAHHTWIPRLGAGRLKRLVLRAATHITVSQAMARHLPVPSFVVPNPFDISRFQVDRDRPPERDVIFVGRLVSDKGVAVLVDALALLNARGRAVQATVVGDGPDAVALAAGASARGLGECLSFAGRVEGDALVGLLQRHRLLVVPSVWDEPFGLVVLEGLACGCLPVVSDSGGLPEATGGLGVVVPRADALALADAIDRSLSRLAQEPDASARLADRAAPHLERHHPDRVAARYLEILHHACRPVEQPRPA